MGVDIGSLAPWAQRQALQKLAAQEREKAAKASKYHNQKDERAAASGAVLRFDSRKEARRFDELSAMLRAGKIRDLQLQPSFTLKEAYTTTEGIRVRAIRYQADFSYERRGESWDGGESWTRVVEDVKSKATKTRVYEMKKKLMREKFGIEIQEV